VRLQVFLERDVIAAVAGLAQVFGYPGASTVLTVATMLAMKRLRRSLAGSSVMVPVCLSATQPQRGREHRT
jgi:hypothetical protein